MSFHEIEYMSLHIKYYINNQQKAIVCQKNRHTREDVTTERGCSIFLITLHAYENLIFKMQLQLRDLEEMLECQCDPTQKSSVFPQ